VAEVYEVPFLIPSATSDLITNQGYDWVFRICAPSGEFASDVFDSLKDIADKKGIQQDVTTMAIVYEDSDFGNATAVAAATQAIKRGIRVVAYEVFERERDDKTEEMIKRLKSLNPQALFFAINYPDDAARLIEKCRKALGDKLYIGGEGGFAEPQFLQKAGPSAEGVVVVTQWDESVTRWDDSENWNGADQFAACYGLDGKPVSMLGAEAYAAIQVAYAAIEKAAQASTVMESRPVPVPEACTPMPTPLSTPTCMPTRETGQRGCLESRSIRDGLLRVDVKTVFGPVRFDYSGQNAHPVLITEVQSRTLKTIIAPGSE
jgi:branched-chain amino acid transport system substrate-binding protein